jgi:hypothetical protein
VVEHLRKAWSPSFKPQEYKTTKKEEEEKKKSSISEHLI